MPQKFRVLISDDKQRRIVIDKEAWDAEGIEKGDLIEVSIRKLKVEK